MTVYGDIMKGLLIKSIMPVRFKRFYDDYKNKEFYFLDVGCGISSVCRTRQYFKKVRYYGIDLHKKEEKLNLMDGFFHIDLSKENISIVPDNFFDVVMMSHVIEHLKNALDILPDIVKKLKKGGIIYIEFPSVTSLSLPNAKDTLNFCDDPTHIRIYSIQEIANCLLNNGMKIIRAGKRRDIVRIFLTPVLIIRDLLKKGTFGASLYDLLGFADYVYAEKVD